MLIPVAGLAAGCLILLLVSLAALGDLRQRLAALARVEAKLDLLLESAGLRYDPFAQAPPQVVDALRCGDKILAIRRYRAASGVGLKDAKDYVDELQRRAGR
jgi:hypothetical protein